MASDGKEVARCDPFPRERMQRYASTHWRPYRTAADLGTLLLRALVETYHAAIEAADCRLQDLQQGYVRGIDEPDDAGNLDEGEYRSSLLQVKWAVDGTSRSLAGLARPAAEPQFAWFQVQDAQNVVTEIGLLIERGGEQLARLRAEIRESLALIAATNASRQLSLSHEIQQRQDAAEKQVRSLETLAQYLAAGFLLPALVAQVLGALPSLYAASPNCRAALVFGATAASAVVSVLVLFLIRRMVAKSH
jgi:hypothetical protein